MAIDGRDKEADVLREGVGICVLGGPILINCLLHAPLAWHPQTNKDSLFGQGFSRLKASRGGWPAFRSKYEQYHSVWDDQTIQLCLVPEQTRFIGVIFDPFCKNLQVQITQAIQLCLFYQTKLLSPFSI
jgi:hypothetical protein